MEETITPFTTDLTSTLRVVLDRTDATLPYSAATVCLVDKDTGQYNVVASRNISTLPWMGKSRTIAGIGRIVIRSRKAVQILDFNTDRRVANPRLFLRQGFVSALALPLVLDADVTGILCFYTDKKHQFTGHEIRSLSALAAQMTIAIRNARLLAQIRHQAAALKNANEILKTRTRQQAVVSFLGDLALAQSDLSALFDAAAALLRQTLQIEHSQILELLPDGKAFRLRAGEGWKAGCVGRSIIPAGARSQAGYTLRCNKAVMVEDLRRERRFVPPPLLREHNVVSGLSVIIRGKDRPFGVLTAHSSEKHAFSPDDVHFLQSVANVLALTIERKREQRALERSERLHRNLAKVSPVGIFSTDRTGICQYVNERCCELCGLTAGEARGRGWVRAIHPDDRKRVLTAWRQGHAFKLEYRLRRPDGSTIWVLGQAIAEFGASGEVTDYVGTITDITERKSLEKQLSDVSENERRRIGQDLHDDLGQQLTGIALLGKGLEQNLIHKHLSESRDAAQIVELVNQTINQTRLLARGLCPVGSDANGLMSALKELAFRTERWFKISCLFECPKPVFIRDNTVATHLYRIAQEALDNAVKHGRADRVVIRLSARKDRNVLMVSDNGAGFQEPARNGNGMGVPIIRHRAAIIQGSVDIRKRYGGGTIVRCAFGPEGEA